MLKTRRRRIVVSGLALLAIAAALLYITDPFGSPTNSSNGTIDNSFATSVTTVDEGPLSEQTQVDATLGYAGSYTVVNQATGSVTALPGVGDVVSQGQSLYAVNGSPVVLLYGSVPAYRNLSVGMTGPDVAELNRALIALGDASLSQVGADVDYFSAATAAALEELQAKLGVEQNGQLPLGQAVFLPSAARITTVPVIKGTALAPGTTVATATATTRVVSVALDAGEQGQVQVGDQVTITLPDNDTTPGVVSYVGKVAISSSSGSTITVDVRPTDPAATGSLDQAPVEVSITTASVSNCLYVPVDALLALASGGYAVEVVGKGGVHQLVAVSLGLFDDAAGNVQVTGDIQRGERVVVPAL